MIKIFLARKKLVNALAFIGATVTKKKEDESTTDFNIKMTVDDLNRELILTTSLHEEPAQVEYRQEITGGLSIGGAAFILSAKNMLTFLNHLNHYEYVEIEIDTESLLLHLHGAQLVFPDLLNNEQETQIVRCESKSKYQMSLHQSEMHLFDFVMGNEQQYSHIVGDEAISLLADIEKVCSVAKQTLGEVTLTIHASQSELKFTAGTRVLCIEGGAKCNLSEYESEFFPRSCVIDLKALKILSSFLIQRHKEHKLDALLCLHESHLSITTDYFVLNLRVLGPERAIQMPSELESDTDESLWLRKVTQEFCDGVQKTRIDDTKQSEFIGLQVQAGELCFSRAADGDIAKAETSILIDILHNPDGTPALVKMRAGVLLPAVKILGDKFEIKGLLSNDNRISLRDTSRGIRVIMSINRC